jgi:hypothetical protein
MKYIGAAAIYCLFFQDYAGPYGQRDRTEHRAIETGNDDAPPSSAENFRRLSGATSKAEIMI